MDMIFKVDYATMENEEASFESEDALANFLSERNFNCFKVKDLIFVDLDSDNVLIFREKPNKFVLMHTFEDASFADLTDIIVDNFDLDDIFPRDIQPITVSKILGVKA